MPNQRTIAAALNLNQSTVSRALRNDPLIPEETRRAVAAAAERLGYHPSPLVSILMERIRSGRDVKDQGCLALVADARDAKDWLHHYTYREQYEGIRRRAARSGYRTEDFFLRSPGMTAGRLDGIFEARGIVGLILTTPKRPDTPPPELNWKRHVCVTTGYSWEAPEIDRVSTRHRQNVDLCFSELWKRGYRRIGMHLSSASLEYADANWTASHLLNQSRVPKKDRLPLFVSEPEVDPFPAFGRWYRRWRPEALITHRGDESGWLEKLGLSYDDLAIACFNLPPGRDLAGVNENSVVVGEMACDLVISKIAHNERGLPEYPRLILIEGFWENGLSVPRKADRI